MTTYCDGTAAKAITELDVDTKLSRHISISDTTTNANWCKSERSPWSGWLHH
jgi:hypothetical protein